jgi:hypothetical protein
MNYHLDWKILVMITAKKIVRANMGLTFQTEIPGLLLPGAHAWEKMSWNTYSTVLKLA